MKKRDSSRAWETGYVTSLDPLWVTESRLDLVQPIIFAFAVMLYTISILVLIRGSFNIRRDDPIILCFLCCLILPVLVLLYGIKAAGHKWDDVRPINEPPLLFALAASDIISMTDGLNDANHSIRQSAIRDAKQIGPDSRSAELNEAMQRIEEIQH